MKRFITISIIFLLLLAVIVPISSKAMSWKSQEKIIIESDETIDGNFYFLSQKVKIDGTVNGDLIGFSEELEVNGRIEGDIIALAENFSFSGEVVGNIRLIANQVDIKGSVARNVNILGVDVFLSDTSQINWDTLILANNLDMRSNISGSLYALVNTAFLNGKIDRDVNMTIRDQEKALSLGEGLVIRNSLYYRSFNPANVSPKAQIDGQIEYKELATKNAFQFIWSLIYKIFSAILIALFLIHLFKNPLKASSENIYRKPLTSFLWGLFFIFIMPLILIFLALTIIGLQLALLIFSLWLVVFLASKVIFAYFIGRFLFNYIIKKPKTKGVWKIIFGIIITWLLFALPFIGSFLVFIAIVLGGGSFFLYLKKLIN